MVHHIASPSKITTWRWLLGMAQASVFSSVYLLAPPYIISAIVVLLWQYPTRSLAWAYATPLLLSIISKPVAAPDLLAAYFKPMADYFQFEAITEVEPDEYRAHYRSGKKFIFAAQPHGVISFCGMCFMTATEPEFRRIKTAAASVVLRFPILKNVMGVYGLMDASAESLKKHLSSNAGVEGSVVLYVGGIAELFKSSRREERLYLSKRKGFVKYALRYGADLVPMYLFGNTSVLSVVKSGPIAHLSRSLQMSVTYFWGKYNLPVPRDDKLLFVSGKPLGMPHIPNPTDADVDKWHAKYCEEVTRLFNTYKEKVPLYKHKQLFID